MKSSRAEDHVQSCTAPPSGATALAAGGTASRRILRALRQCPKRRSLASHATEPRTEPFCRAKIVEHTRVLSRFSAFCVPLFLECARALLRQSKSGPCVGVSHISVRAAVTCPELPKAFFILALCSPWEQGLAFLPLSLLGSHLLSRQRRSAPALLQMPDCRPPAVSASPVAWRPLATGQWRFLRGFNPHPWSGSGKGHACSERLVMRSCARSSSSCAGLSVPLVDRAPQAPVVWTLGMLQIL